MRIPRGQSERLLLFGRNFLKHPRMLGSVIPSSRFLVNRLLAQVDWTRARVILEYGPGVGTVTTEILRRMAPDAVLVAIETNADFVRFLRRRIQDPRLQLVHGSAANADDVLAGAGLEQADYVISGIPYTTMPEGTRDQILRKTHALLHPHGTFLVFQFTRAVLPSLRGLFGIVREEFELRNVMPARLFYCRRNAERRTISRPAPRPPIAGPSASAARLSES
jgi:phospholipid N-methyltransferase